MNGYSVPVVGKGEDSSDRGPSSVEPLRHRETEDPTTPLACRMRSATMRGYFNALEWISAMKVLSSLKSAKQRHRDCKIVRRRGKVFVICKSNPRFKARQR